jgi:predicted NBD/HSP70 family sugar kinase
MPKIRFSHQHTLQILQLIRAKGSIARSDVAEKTGDSTFLISKIFDELLERDFITEVGRGDSTGGRRPTLLSLRPGLGRLIGIHFGTVNLRIAITDFSGNTIAYSHGLSRAEEGPSVAIPHLMELIDQMLDANGIAYSDLNGIGIGISVVMDPEGVVLYWPRLSRWANVPIKKMIEERYKTLVVLDDSPRTAALAEYHLGGANESKSFVFIAIGAGTGATLFLNGSLYRGVGGFAGEFGHISVSERGSVCSCGNRGCLETVVSASELIHRARQGLARGLSNALTQMSKGVPENITVEMLAKAALEGDRFAVRLLTDTGVYLGRAIVSLVNLLNPDLIVIGGGIASAAGELLLPEIERVVRETAMIHSAKQVELRLSKLDEKASAIGATLLVAEGALERLFLRNWDESERMKATARHKRMPHRSDGRD